MKVSVEQTKMGGSGARHVPALDGVRAVAVVLVFLFHLGVPGFDSGFLGVDVFFVLSGFLITTLLIHELGATGRISLPGFWARRALRLLPALVVVLLVLGVVGSLTGTFAERTALRGDLLATTGYVANWHLISTSTYFSDTGIVSPLQHTWSLAIEEQFYLLWPVILLGGASLWRRPRAVVLVLATLGTLVSVALLATLWQPDAVERAYMGTDARIFEPLIGAIGAALVASPAVASRIERWGSWLVAAGCLGVVSCLVLIEPAGSLYYVGGALLLSVSTAAVVAALWLERGGALRRGLSWQPVAWVGLISYGLYLWHFPISLWLGSGEPSSGASVGRKLLMIVLTFVVATVSFYAIERPIRQGRWRGGRHVVARRRSWSRTLIAVPITLLAVACTSVVLTRVPPPAPGQPVLILVGDSVTLRLAVPLERAFSTAGWRLVSGAHGGCAVTGEKAINPSGKVIPFSVRCPDEAMKLQDEAIDANDPDVVVWWDRVSIAGFLTADGEPVFAGSPTWWELRRQRLAETVERLSRDGAFVVFVGTEPPGRGIGPSGCFSVGVCEWQTYQVERYWDVTARWDRVLRTFAERHPDVAAYVDITSDVCRSIQAPCDDTVNGRPARKDGVHYSGAGERLVVEALVRRLTPTLARLQDEAGASM